MIEALPLFDIEISSDQDVPPVTLRWPWPLRVMYYRSVEGDYVFDISGELPDSRTGEMDYWRVPSRRATPIPRNQFAHELREALREHVLHEIDEAIVVDGVRLFDPHVPHASTRP